MSRLLLLSSSRAGNTGYLEHAKPMIEDFLASTSVKHVLFIPFAGVGKSFDIYLEQVRPAFEALGLRVEGIHQVPDPQEAVRRAETIAVGGGNTFALVKRLYDANLMEVLQERVAEGTPYIGWSAGSNIAGPTLCTTNDMPIVEPPSFKTLGLVPFQINPHFLSGKPAGHNGESREERLSEYLALNPDSLVVALREGTALWREGDALRLVGEFDGLTFTADQEETLKRDCPLDHLLKRERS